MDEIRDPRSERRRYPWWLGPAAATAALLYRILLVTSRVRIHRPENEARARAGGRPVIFSIWHGELLLPIHTRRNRSLSVITSLSADGELVTRFVRRFGYYCVRGSSSREGRRALTEMRRRVEDGFDAVITPDGPRGPRHSVHGGIVSLARMTGARIVPVGAAASRRKELGSWDRFVVPLPFARIVLSVGEPIFVDRHADTDATRERIREEMDRAGAEARAQLGRRSRGD